jgi:hypothetical protein
MFLRRLVSHLDVGRQGLELAHRQPDNLVREFPEGQRDPKNVERLRIAL